MSSPGAPPPGPRSSGPEQVIRIEELDPLAPARCDSQVSGSAASPVALLEKLACQEASAGGHLAEPIRHDGPRSVGGSVVHDECLERAVCLRRHRGERLLDEAIRVERRDNDGHERRGAGSTGGAPQESHLAEAITLTSSALPHFPHSLWHTKTFSPLSKA